MTQQAHTLDYQPTPALSQARRQSIRLLLACAALFVLMGVNFLGCDVIFLVYSRGPGHLPTLDLWRYTLFSFDLWRTAPAESLQGLVLGLVMAVPFFLAAWGIRRGRRWPALGGMILAFLVSLVGLISCVATGWRFIHPGRFGPWVLQMGAVALAVGMITLFPLTGVKLLKVWREQKR